MQIWRKSKFPEMSVSNMFEKQLVNQCDWKRGLENRRRPGQRSETEYVRFYSECLNKRSKGQWWNREGHVGGYCHSLDDRGWYWQEMQLRSWIKNVFNSRANRIS